MINDLEYLFICLLAFWIFLMRCLCKSFVHVLFELSVHCLLICRSGLNIWDTSSLSLKIFIFSVSWFALSQFFLFLDNTLGCGISEDESPK